MHVHWEGGGVDVVQGQGLSSMAYPVQLSIHF